MVALGVCVIVPSKDVMYFRRRSPRKYMTIGVWVHVPAALELVANYNWLLTVYCLVSTVYHLVSMVQCLVSFITYWYVVVVVFNILFI